jgi:uncharacterized membrane protein
MANSQNELEALRAQVAALTVRVYQLELARDSAPGIPLAATAPSVQQTDPAPPATGVPESGIPRVGVKLPAAPVPSPRPPQPNFQLNPMPASAWAEGDLEKKIGQYWLNRVGIAAMLIGVSYFIKYAFENNWIGAGGRIATGLLAGIGLVLWSERFRAAGHAAFSYSLKAVGIGALYLSLWGAFQVYHLIPSAAAFLAMIIVTAATIVMALSQNAEILASFAMIGGFTTPILLSTGQNHEAVLFSYVALLDIAILAMAIVRPWRRLLWGSFAGTIILYVGWYSSFYPTYYNLHSGNQRPLTVFFSALFAAIFAAVPLTTRYERSTKFAGPSITLVLLPLLNAAVFFLQLYAIYEQEPATLTWFALALGAVYLGIGAAFKKRFPGEDTVFLNLLHVAIAIAFITIAIPLKLDAQWITIGWLIESAVLLWISARTKVNFLRYLAVAALVLGIFRLLFYDNFRAETLVFNARFATYAIAIAVLGGIAYFGKRQTSEKELPLLQLAVVMLNFLALIALTLEASDYFARQLALPGSYAAHFHQVSLVQGFTYSAIWMIYGAVLMAVGFRNRSAFVRWQALILIAFTTVKVFLYDVSQLGGSYRILSFIALGAVLLGISFIYQRDWLKLSPRSSADSPKETP